MADNSIVQTIKDAEIDARSLSEFIYRPANFTVYRRLAPPIHTLDYYLNKLDVISDDLEGRVKDVLSSMGFIIKGSFADGATLSTYNDAMVDGSGVLYRWGGALPKTVPAGSTPANTGGFADNAWVAISSNDMTGIASGKALNGSGAVLVDGAAIYIDSYQKLSTIPPAKLKEGHVAKVRGTDFAWSGTEWKPVGRIYVNSWGARGDAPKRINETNATNSKQAFIDAASYALEHGHSHVFAEAGIYYTPDLTCDDMQEVYIVGDGVFFTYANGTISQAGHAKVLALTEKEYANGVAWNSRNNSNTNGRMAFVFDDGTWTQFAVLPHLFKKYGVSYGIAWHTSYDNHDWIKEVYRHGVEILSHTPDNADCTSLSDEQLAQRAEADLAAIEAITGRRDNVHFVYPQHVRDARTDNILSQYFVTGRGVESSMTQPNDQAGSWLCASASIENRSLESVYRIIDSVVRTNSNIVFYGHGYDFNQVHIIESIIKYALSSGINFSLPSQVKTAPVNHFQRYFKNPDEWNLGTNTTWSEEVSSPLGVRSIRAFKEGTGFSSFGFELKSFQISSSNKNYAHYKLSFLYKSEQGVTSSSSFGLGVKYTYRKRAGRGDNESGLISNNYAFSSLPAADFDNKIELDVFVPVNIVQFMVGLSGNNITVPFDLYIDDFRLTKVAEVDTAIVEAKVGERVASVIMGGEFMNSMTVVPDNNILLNSARTANINSDKHTLQVVSNDPEDGGKSAYVTAIPKNTFSNYLGY